MGIGKILEDFAANLTSLVFTGHSLGGGVGTILSMMAATWLEQNGHAGLLVDAVLFAPPTAGDATFVAAFNQRVNARMIKFANDVVPQVREEEEEEGNPAVPEGASWLRATWMRALTYSLTHSFTPPILNPDSLYFCTLEYRCPVSRCRSAAGATASRSTQDRTAAGRTSTAGAASCFSDRTCPSRQITGPTWSPFP
jgi:hypothetical protein